MIFSLEYKNLFEYHGLAWKLGKESLHYFCEIFLHNPLFDYESGNVPLSQKHFEIWDEIEYSILNENGTKKCYIFPRSFGKTATINTSVVIWSALYCLHPYNVIVSSTSKQAEGFIANIKSRIEDNEYIKKSFGEIINKDLKYNASEIELDIKPQRAKIECFSSTSAVRGINYCSYRVGLLVLDDAQDENQIKTEATRADLVKRIDDGILKALQMNNNHVIALGTVQYKNDLYDTFYSSLEWRTRKEKCVLIDDIDKYFHNHEHWLKVKSILKDKNNPYAEAEAKEYYYDHKAEMDFPIIWENYSRFELAIKYYANPVSFKQEYQSDIDNLGERRIYTWDERPAQEIESQHFTKTILSVDPASTVNEKSDYSAFCILSEAENGLLYARKCQIKKLLFEDYINNIIDLLLTYTDINTVSIEKQTYNGADVFRLRELIAQNPELKSRNLRIINKARSKNKESRIAALCVPTINMKRVVFNNEDGEAITQITSFCGVGFTAHDDMIDCLADAIEYLPEVKKQGGYSYVSFRDIGYF